VTNRSMVLSILGFIFFFIFVSSIVILADGLSGGKLLSLNALWHDMVNLDPGFFLRIFAWLVLLFPIIGIFAVVYKRVTRF
jgi:hypothetical protein